MGITDCPISVSEYSTLGGISANCSRWTKPSVSSVLSVVESTLGEMSGIALERELKRMVLSSLIISKTNRPHLLPKRAITFLTGQISINAFASSFFLIVTNYY